MKTAKILSLATALALTGGLACKNPVAEKARVDQAAADEAARKAAAEKAEADRLAAEKAAAEKAAAEKAAAEAAEAARKAAAEKAAAEKAAAFKAAAEAALKNIHFDFDKSDIKEADRATLQAIADFMKANADAKILIEGHCDERGTNDYNLQLGNRRAAAALAYLKTLGVAEERFETTSFGKEKPLCTEGKESCWNQNRRCEFKLKG